MRKIPLKCNHNCIFNFKANEFRYLKALPSNLTYTVGKFSRIRRLLLISGFLKNESSLKGFDNLSVPNEYFLYCQCDYAYTRIAISRLETIFFFRVTHERKFTIIEHLIWECYSRGRNYVGEGVITTLQWC